MATYSTLEEIKVDTQANPSSNNLIVLRSKHLKVCSFLSLLKVYVLPKL